MARTRTTASESGGAALPPRTRQRLSRLHRHLQGASATLNELLGTGTDPVPGELHEQVAAVNNEPTYWYSGGQWFKCEWDPVYNKRNCRPVDAAEVPAGQAPG
jgi:hypothetical protein